MENFNFNSIINICRFRSITGIHLLLWPCFWGLIFAKQQLMIPTKIILEKAILFIFGAIFMRTAGCILNDIIDYRLDKRVVRTQSRPLPSGSLSFDAAFLLFIFFLLLGACVFFYLPYEAKITAIIGLVLLFIYPFTKYFFPFPQLILGFAFNIGVIVSFLTLHPSFSIPYEIYILYTIGIIWTLIYDTFYGFQDVQDDEKAQVHSTSIILKHKKNVLLFLIIIMFMLLCYFIKSVYGFLGNIFLVFLQIYFYQQCNINTPISCLTFFKRQKWIGGIITIILFL